MQDKEEIDDEALTSLLSPSSSSISLPRRAKKTLLSRVVTIIVPGLIGAGLASLFWVTVTPHLVQHQYLHSSEATHSDETYSATPLPEIHHQVLPGLMLECGNSSAEARASNCVFQLWSYSWVPAPCFDPELTADFQEVIHKENLSYYLPRQGTGRLDKVDIEIALEGEKEVLYSVWGLHYWHCAFYAQNFFRSRVALTNADLEVRHSEHCMEWFSQPTKFDWHAVNIKLPLAFHTCEVSSGKPLAILEWENTG
jgi:hypothetical protein